MAKDFVFRPYGFIVPIKIIQYDDLLRRAIDCVK